MPNAEPPSLHAQPLPVPAETHATPRSTRSSLFYLFLVVGCVTCADLLLKRGAAQVHAASPGSLLNRLGIGALASPFTIAGILFHLGGLASWMLALRKIPLAIAFSFLAVQQATIALGAWLWLGEYISLPRFAGIILLIMGVLLLVPSIIAAETRTEAPLPEVSP